MILDIFYRRSPSFWILVFLLILSPVFYTIALNVLGPSTEYHNPSLPTAEKGADGRSYVYVGDELYVFISIVRHKINGNCRFEIARYAENIGGFEHGKKHPISYASLQFIGQNELRRARWPSPPDEYIIGYDVNEKNEPQIDKPLLPNGIDEQEFDLYVVGRYYCNLFDYIFPRYIQGGENPNETPRIRVVIRRHRL